MEIADDSAAVDSIPVVVSSDEESHRALPPLPPPYLPPAELELSPPHVPPAELVPAGGIDEEDGYFAYPADMMAPLPDSLPLGLPPQVQPRGRKRSAPPGGIGDLRAGLEAEPCTNVKVHMKQVRTMMKKPAGAGVLLKRPAAAIEAAVLDAAVVPAAPDPDQDQYPGDGEAAMGETHMDVMARCIKLCLGPPTDGHRSKVVVSWQRKPWVFQLKDMATKKLVTHAPIGSSAARIVLGEH